MSNSSPSPLSISLASSSTSSSIDCELCSSTSEDAGYSTITGSGPFSDSSGSSESDSSTKGSSISDIVASYSPSTSSFPSWAGSWLSETDCSCSIIEFSSPLSDSDSSIIAGYSDKSESIPNISAWRDGGVPSQITPKSSTKWITRPGHSSST